MKGFIIFLPNYTGKPDSWYNFLNLDSNFKKKLSKINPDFKITLIITHVLDNVFQFIKCYCNNSKRFN